MNRYIWHSPLKDFWSSYRKLAWMGFEPTTTEFCSNALTNWAIRPWVQLAHRANFVQLLQFHLFVQCSHFIPAIAFISHHIYFKQNLAQVITLVVEWIDTYGIHQWRIFEVAIESWVECDLNPQPLNFVQTLSDWAIRPWAQLSLSQLCTATPISSLCLVFTFHFSCCLRQSPYLL